LKKVDLKLIIPYVILLVFVCKQSCSQNNFILAGDSIGQGIIFTDIPDSTVSANLSNSIMIDLNQDNSNDLDISGFFYGGSTFYESSIRVTNIGNTCVAIDSSNSYPKVFSINEQIDSSCLWGCDSIPQDLITTQTELMPPYETHFYGNFWTVSNKYLATRTIIKKYIIYGWVKLSTQGSEMAIIKSYAIKKLPSPVPEIPIDNRYSVYPNPFKTNISIEIFKMQKESILLLYDTYGHEILKQKIQNKKTYINLSDLVSGVYFLKIVSPDFIQIKRIIKAL
jgi:hypothetical protein